MIITSFNLSRAHDGLLASERELCQLVAKTISLPAVDKLNVREDTAPVNVERIRERLQEAQFRPFAVVTSSGHKYPVPHTDFILLTPKVLIVADLKGSTTGVDPLHIVALEDLPARGNGAQYRRRWRK